MESNKTECFLPPFKTDLRIIIEWGPNIQDGPSILSTLASILNLIGDLAVAVCLSCINIIFWEAHHYLWSLFLCRHIGILHWLFSIKYKIWNLTNNRFANCLVCIIAMLTDDLQRGSSSAVRFDCFWCMLHLIRRSHRKCLPYIYTIIMSQRMEFGERKGCSGTWTRDLSHPKRESYH